MVMRIIGIDLGVTAKHRASILDPATNEFTHKNIAFHPLPEQLDALIAKARQKAGKEAELVAVLEATGMAWYPVSSYLVRQQVKVYRVNGRATKALRKVENPHARSDSIDSQVLARLYFTCPDQLEPLQIATGEQLSLQRYCREFIRWRDTATAARNRMTALDQWVWNGLTTVVPTIALPWMRQHWYDPWQVVAAGEQTLLAEWRTYANQSLSAGDGLHSGTFERSQKTLDELAGVWIPAWVQRAQTITRLYDSPKALDIQGICISLDRFRQQFDQASAQKTLLQDTLIQPLYQRLYPDCLLETIYGIGSDSAAIYMAFIHSIDRFSSAAKFRQWCGMVPGANQSGTALSKGIHITQAGPDFIKATLYLNADCARHWDIALANLYFNQMVHYGKHHSQALCACASHLADRIFVVLKEKRPYQLRSLDGNPISAADSHRFILEHFHVPDDVRNRSNCRSRRRRDDLTQQ